LKGTDPLTGTKSVRLVAFCFVGAVDTQQHCRIEVQAALVYLFAAAMAMTEVIVVESQESRVDRLQALLLPVPRCLRHGLTLHGIHSRQAADFALVELDRCRRLRCRVRDAFDFRSQSKQPFPPVDAHADAATPTTSVPHIVSNMIQLTP